MLSLINDIRTDTLQSLSAFLTGFITNQQILVQNRCLTLFKADKLQAAMSLEERQAAVGTKLHQQVSSNEKQISSLDEN